MRKLLKTPLRAQGLAGHSGLHKCQYRDLWITVKTYGKYCPANAPTDKQGCFSCIDNATVILLLLTGRTGAPQNGI